jgi:hypothetical protein
VLHGDVPNVVIPYCAQRYFPAPFATQPGKSGLFIRLQRYCYEGALRRFGDLAAKLFDVIRHPSTILRLRQTSQPRATGPRIADWSPIAGSIVFQLDAATAPNSTPDEDHA